jgi:hypothetical protein
MVLAPVREPPVLVNGIPRDVAIGQLAHENIKTEALETYKGRGFYYQGENL